MRETKVKYLRGIVGDEKAFDAAYVVVKAEYPTDLPLALVLVSHMVKGKDSALSSFKKNMNTTSSSTTTTVTTITEGTVADTTVVDPRLTSVEATLKATDAVIEAGTAVISLVDQDSVARTMGVNVDKDDTVQAATRKEAEIRRAAILEAAAAMA